jgi:beta-phosphoglucomutase
VFLKGARLAGALPENSIVFEDAPLGVEAGGAPACAPWC